MTEVAGVGDRDTGRRDRLSRLQLTNVLMSCVCLYLPFHAHFMHWGHHLQQSEGTTLKRDILNNPKDKCLKQRMPATDESATLSSAGGWEFLAHKVSIYFTVLNSPFKSGPLGDFPSRPVVKSLQFHCRGHKLGN